MLIKIQLHFIFSFVLFISVYTRDIVLKLDTKQIIDSIISETSVKYLTKLAQVFAKKAAEAFIKEIQNKEHLLPDSKRTKSETKKPHYKRLYSTTEKSVTNKEILNEEEAYKLLETPSPDGDHLGWHSQEHTFEEEQREEAKKIPVYGLVKINGIYVRRLLGVGTI